MTRRAAPFDQSAAVVPSEHDEQRSLFEWAALHEWHEPRLAMLFAIPNGGARHPVVAARLKAEGVRPGVPDLFLACAGIGARPDHDGGTGWLAHGLFVELKRTRGGTVSAEQRAWHARLRRGGYRVEVCKGWQEAASAICDYLDRDDMKGW